MRISDWSSDVCSSDLPAHMELATIDFFSADAEWARLRRPEVERSIHARLGRLSDWLDEKDYLEGRFTVGDLMMAAVMRELRHPDFLAAHANIDAYTARGQDRPARPEGSRGGKEGGRTSRTR